MEHHHRRLPWEAPIRPARRPLPWLRFVLIAFVCGMAGMAGLVGFNSFHTGDTAAVAMSPVCQEPVEYPGAIPPDFTVDPALQTFASDLLSKHPAVLTMAFGMDLRSARPLFLATRMGNAPVGHDLSLITAPRYPFASLAKILTSAAAIATTGLEPNSPTYLRGQPHTLYKFQLKPDTTGIQIPLCKAFALSINPIFGKLGVNQLGSRTILQWADSLGFNRANGLGNGVPAGRMASPVDSYNLAEISSGFVRTTLGSPVQAAMIARKFAGDGKFCPPAWSGFEPDSGCSGDTAQPDVLRSRMLQLFRATVDSGTASGGFTAAWPVGEREGFQIGGKTGSLDGTDPVGRYEWFTGFARLDNDPNNGIALAVLTVNDSHGSLSATWTSASLLAAWSRHFEELSEPVPVSQSLEAGKPLLTTEDNDALNERAWHRAWRPHKKAKSHHRKRR